MFGRKKNSELEEVKAEKISLKKAKKNGKRSSKGRLKAWIKKTAAEKQFRLGTYTAATTVIVLVILVVVNMCVSALPSKYTSFDMTSDNLYSVSEQTESILEGLNEPVKVYWIAQEGAEDETVKRLLENYEELSKNFDYEKVDPVVNPTFAAQYTSEGIYNNSLIVVNADESKSRYVGYYDIFSTSYDENYNETVEYNGEAALTSAVNFVSTDKQTALYALTGHGEDEIPSNLKSGIEGENMTLSELNLLTEEAVPTDCETLVIYSPARDISDTETKKIRTYLADGGALLLFTDCDAENLGNIYGIMSEYGMEPVEGMIVEADGSYFMGSYPNYLMPKIESHEITDPIADGNYYVLLPVAQGLRIATDKEYSGVRATDNSSDAYDDDTEADEIQTAALLRTTDGAYSKIDGIKATKAEKEKDDIDAGADGFALAAAGESSADGSKVVWIGSSTIADASIDEAVAGANTDLVLNSVGWMCEIEESVSIRAKTVASDYLSLTSAQTSRWTTVMVGVVPLMFIAVGIYVCIRRRRLHG